MPATAEPAQKPGKLLRCPQEGCGKVFRSSPGYRYHLKSHDIDPRPHVCHVCHKKFKSANGLKYHLRKAHHIEPVVSKQNATNNSGSNNASNNNNNNNTSKNNKNNNNNNNNVNANSPKDRESLSSEEDHLFNLAESFNSRGYINNNNNNTNGGGSFGGDRTSSIPPSPLVKSPLGGLNSPLIKNIPLSPLIKSPIDYNQYLSTSSTGSGVQSPYTPAKDGRYFFDHRRPNDFSRKYGALDDFQQRNSSLSEYTQQCQQANMEFRNQCQRLSTGDLSNPRLPPVDFSAQQRACDYFDRRVDGGSVSGGGYIHPHGGPSQHMLYNNNNNTYNNNNHHHHHPHHKDELQYTSLNDVKPSSLGANGRLFPSYKDLVPAPPPPSSASIPPPPIEGKEYPNELMLNHHHNHNHHHNLVRSTSCGGGLMSMNNNNNNNNNMSCSGYTALDSRNTDVYSNSLNLPLVSANKTNNNNNQCHLQNTEQIVPDISSPGCQPSPPTYDRNNNNNNNNNLNSQVKRGTSESSIETEMSDSVFQNDNSRMSPIVPTSSLSPVLPSPDIIKKLRTDSDSKEFSFPGKLCRLHRNYLHKYTDSFLLIL